MTSAEAKARLTTLCRFIEEHGGPRGWTASTEDAAAIRQLLDEVVASNRSSAECLAALRGMVVWFGRPGREEWMTQDAFEQAEEIANRAKFVLTKYDAKPPGPPNPPRPAVRNEFA